MSREPKPFETPLERRVSSLEARTERLEMPVDSRDAIVWEMGRVAAQAGATQQDNPFQKRERAPWPSR